MFLRIDEMVPLPKPANTAYMVINGNRDIYEQHQTSNWERKTYTHTFHMKS